MLQAALLSVVVVTVIVCRVVVVGLVALLHFFVWLCVSAKNANVLPNALAYVIAYSVLNALNKVSISI